MVAMDVLTLDQCKYCARAYFRHKQRLLRALRTKEINATPRNLNSYERAIREFKLASNAYQAAIKPVFDWLLECGGTPIERLIIVKKYIYGETIRQIANDLFFCERYIYYIQKNFLINTNVWAK